MPCTPPRPFQSEPLPAFRRPGARNVVYPPRRNNRTYYDTHATLPNNGNVCSDAAGEREFAPLTLYFSSLAGSGSLGGVSGYRPTGNTQADGDPEAPWNVGPFRKWTRRTITGHNQIIISAGDGLINCGQCSLQENDGAAIFAPDAFATVLVWARARSRIFGGGISDACGTDFTDWSDIEDITPFINGAAGPNTFDLCTPTTQASLYIGVSGDATYSGTITATLSDPDTEFSALTRSGGAVAGEARETLPPAYDVTSPKWKGAIGFTNAVAVRVTATFAGLNHARQHVLRGVHLLRPLLGGATVAVPFEAPATISSYTATLSHDLPIITGHGVSLAADSLRLIAL